MAQDYKNHKRKPDPPRKVPGWVWFLIGLLVGLFVAFLVYLRLYSTAGLELITPPAVRESKQSVREAAGPAERQPSAPKPRFEFYTILPEMEVPVPESELPLRRKDTSKQLDGSTSYLLQAGSFRSFKEADRLKARLALMGMEVAIQTIAIDGRDTWHRVRIGPFRGLSPLDKARNRLAEHGMEAMVLKVKN